MKKESIETYRKITKEAIKEIPEENINKIVSISKLKRENKMLIKIMTEKFIVDGKRYRGLVSWEGFFRIEELPQEYIDGMAAAFYSNPEFNFKSERTILIRCQNGEPLLELKEYPEREFQEILSYIRKAGENLRRINQKIKLEQWEGKEEFII